uniref:Uncharacterized protein n=1 Tax=Anguilla anguilla TaxID=7936 RepID=A0A0E9PG60_ANGAN
MMFNFHKQTFSFQKINMISILRF